MGLISTLPPQQQVEFSILHDARCVHDIATINYAEYVAGKGAKWALIGITPDKESGTSTIPGGYVNAETGAVVVPPDGQLVQVKKGTFELLAGSGAALPDSGRYDWREPVEEERRGVRAEDVYSPFCYGGTLLFVPDNGQPPQAYYQVAALLFPQWSNYAAPAIAAYAGHSETLYSEKTGNAADLSRLLKNPNPLLAAFGFRKALRSGQFIPDAFASLSREQAAVYTGIAIRDAAAPKWAEWEADMRKAIRATTDAGQLEAIATGAFTPLLFGCTEAIGARARDILHEVRRKAAATSQLAYSQKLAFIFQRAGIR